MNPSLSWMIDQSDQGQYYLQANNDNHFHNSDGLGEGIISLIFIVDALYDSKPDGMIVIDEPELSLHPAYQRRLARLFADYAKDRQIVYATHSPYFVDFTHILNGAEIARVHKRDGGSSISQLSRSTAAQLRGFLTDHHNPHTLFDSIKADDVRTKLEESLHGLLDENHELRSECVAETKGECSF